MKLSAPVHRLKRQARLMSRDQGIPLHQALDQVAAREGFAQWSLLSSRADARPGEEILDRFEPGDLVLVAARPGQGKTRLALRLLAEAARAGRHAAFLTLDYTRKGVLDLLAELGLSGAEIVLDCSDDLSAATIEARFGNLPSTSVIVVDYLQLLDQDRRKPPLEDQVRALHALARRHGLVIVCLSQIDRRYDPAERPLPCLEDVRQPNPFDLKWFDKAFFLQGGTIQFELLTKR